MARTGKMARATETHADAWQGQILAEAANRALAALTAHIWQTEQPHQREQALADGLVRVLAQLPEANDSALMGRLLAAAARAFPHEWEYAHIPEHCASVFANPNVASPYAYIVAWDEQGKRKSRRVRNADTANGLADMLTQSLGAHAQMVAAARKREAARKASATRKRKIETARKVSEAHTSKLKSA